jgi:hypothetical protein
MANDVLFIGWGPVVRGRERQAIDVFQESVQSWMQYQQDGRIESFEPILLEPHGGELAGFVLIRGERHKLDELRLDDEFRRNLARANTVVEDLGVVCGYGEDALARQLGLFQEAAGALA